MKLKTIFLTGIFSLLLISGLWAQSSERVYIRECFSTGKTVVIIYEKGDTKRLEIENVFNKKGEELKSIAGILEKYLGEGYKIISSVNYGSPGDYTQYILEKP